ncbi:two-component response regulator ARR10-like isoform X2 [Gastrolobium bilobum]|uniref:two-component response regulator ARR10-like isoform X2 n=1 Tax=Gastrolobium bilobum TaxID=150636 RepID=UPI002AB1C461|nr:two-component response regulator ARR10-like isoform X2 [Gastrolobium bilobum]
MAVAVVFTIYTMALVNDDNDNDIGDGFPIGMRVLLVDNDRESIFSLGTMLRSCQYQVTTATDATTVLKMLRVKMLRENKFDLVISELHMPEIDGLKLLKLMQPWMDIPVILFSNDYDKNLVMKAVTLGACDYLLKPIRIEELRIFGSMYIERRLILRRMKIKIGTHQPLACLN